jgi:hypothetical protein
MTARMLGSPEVEARGVYRAFWRGPNGEIVLLAITSVGQLLDGAPVVVPMGADHVQMSERLWAKLDELDPMTDEARRDRRRATLQLVRP